MELEQLKTLWQGLDEKLDRNWKLNLELIKQSNLDKARKKMNSLIWLKGLEISFYGAFTAVFVYMTVVNWPSLGLAGTGIVFAIWTLSICIGAVHELVMITEIDYAEPVATLQKKLIRIRLAIIKYLRLAVWILPFYFGFVILFFKVLWNVDIVAVGDPDWIKWNLVIAVVLFLPLAIWMHIKLNPKNANKKWMHSLLRGMGSQINDALHLLDEVENFEKDRSN